MKKKCCFYFDPFAFVFGFNSMCMSFYIHLCDFVCAYRNALDLLPTAVFPNFPPGGHIDDENNQKAIEALKNAKEYTIVNEEDALQQESILSKYYILTCTNEWKITSKHGCVVSSISISYTNVYLCA